MTKVLPGERIISPEHVAVIARVEGFRGLIRAKMQDDFAQGKELEAGDIYVTHIRGAPLLNVTVRTTGREPEVVWLAEMREGGNKITGSQLARSVAVAAGEKNISRTDLLDYCYEHIHGKNIQNPKSPLRIVPNIDFAVQDRKISFDPAGGKADNSVGVAVLGEQVSSVSLDQMQRILTSEAQRLGTTVAALLDPKHLSSNLRKSPLLKKVLQLLAKKE